jgi:hypothetical protein
VDIYVTLLLVNELPFAPWVAALVWLALFLANHYVVRAAHAANEAQRLIIVEDWNAVRQGSRPKHIALQVVLAVVIFLLGLLLRGPVYVFLVGGLIVALSYVLALNLQGLLSARAIALPGAVTGSLTYSTAAALRQMSHRLVGGAVASLIAGLALAHLALLGGAFILSAFANGYRKRARKASAR